MKLVRVLWHDAHTVMDEWTALGDIDPEPCLCETVGHLVPDAKPGHVVVVLNMADGYSFGGDGVAIPEQMVQHIEELRPREDSWSHKAHKWWSSSRRS